MILRKAALTTALVATIGAGVVPAAGQAATTKTSPTITKHYNVATGAILANGKRTVPVTVTVTNPQNSVKSWWSKSNVENVANLSLTGGWQKPFRFQGFRCVPTFPNGIDGYKANFTCKLQGADVPTTVTLKFAAKYTVPYSQLDNR